MPPADARDIARGLDRCGPEELRALATTPIDPTPSVLHDLLAAGPHPWVPFHLWRLRASCDVGTAFELDLDDPALGRWDRPLLEATLEGGGFVPADDDRWERSRTLADLVGPDLDVLMVGLNPSLVAADAGVGFAGATNRFWPAAIDAGLVSVDRDPLHAFVHHRMGMTDLVKRATPAAKDVKASEFRHGVDRLERTVSWLRPRIVCVVGITGWRTATRDKMATEGVQPARFGGRPVYVMPNPSGLNAHVTRADLAERFREVMRLAAAERACD